MVYIVQISLLVEKILSGPEKQPFGQQVLGDTFNNSPQLLFTLLKWTLQLKQKKQPLEYCIKHMRTASTFPGPLTVYK